MERRRKLELILRKTGTVLDIGATFVPRKRHLRPKWKNTPSDAVTSDWTRVAGSFEEGRGTRVA
jgi:hypothetical protein